MRQFLFFNLYISPPLFYYIYLSVFVCTEIEFRMFKILRFYGKKVLEGE